MSAEYLVTTPPGAYVHGVGFVGVGKIFTAPKPDYVPSRHGRAMNEEAQAGLKKVQSGLREQAKAWAEKAKSAPTEAKRLSAHERAVQLEDQAGDMNLDLVSLPKPEPKVKAGMSLKEMGEKEVFANPMTKKSEKRTADK